MSHIVMRPPKSQAELGEDDVKGLIGDSPELDSIKQAIDEMGLKPIWLKLIRQFGFDMFLKGFRAARTKNELQQSDSQAE